MYRSLVMIQGITGFGCSKAPNQMLCAKLYADVLKSVSESSDDVYDHSLCVCYLTLWCASC